MTTLFVAAALVYACATALYLGFLVGLPERVMPWARRALVAGFLIHLLELGARGIAGFHPVTSVRDVIGFAAWVFVGIFLFVERRRRLDAVGAIVSPAALVLLLVARLSPEADHTAGLGFLGRFHIMAASIGVSLFAVAAAAAVFYLLEARQLRRRRMTGLVKRGAALETLDRMANRCVEIGFPIFTGAIIAGVVWGTRRDVGLRPEHVISAVAWIAFAVVLVARATAGWRGRKAAAITLFGFAAIVAVLCVYLARAVA